MNTGASSLPQRRRQARAGLPFRPSAAGAGVDALGAALRRQAERRQLGRRCRGACSHRGRPGRRSRKRSSGLRVVRAALRLPQRRRVGLEAERGQLVHDQPFDAGHRARAVDILEAQQPAAAVRARVEPAGQRGHQRAGVQRAAGRGCEAADIAAARRQRAASAINPPPAAARCGVRAGPCAWPCSANCSQPPAPAPGPAAAFFGCGVALSRQA